MKIRDRVGFTVENGIARVSLQRPEKHNALDIDMFLAITEAQKQLAANPDARAVVLSGAGVDFCTGLDVKSIMRNRSGMLKLLWKWLPWRANLAQQVSVGWRNLPVPVFSAIQGRCWGGGLQIALGTDFRIVRPEASLSIMEARWGLIPDMGGTLAVRELMRRDQALWLTLSADQISGSRAVELGLATQTADDPVAASLEMASQLLDTSPDVAAAAKRLFRHSWTGNAGKALARESWYQVRILGGRNQKIAVRRQSGDKADYVPARKW